MKEIFTDHYLITVQVTRNVHLHIFEWLILTLYCTDANVHYDRNCASFMTDNAVCSLARGLACECGWQCSANISSNIP